MVVSKRDRINESQTVTIRCKTNGANPPAQITWTRANNKFEQLSEQHTNVSYGGKITTSTLLIEAHRQFNQQIYQCCLQNSPHNCSNDWTLNVKCKCPVLGYSSLLKPFNAKHCMQFCEVVDTSVSSLHEDQASSLRNAEAFK